MRRILVTGGAECAPLLDGFDSLSLIETARGRLAKRKTFRLTSSMKSCIVLYINKV